MQHCERIFSCPGDSIKKTYTPRVGPCGRLSLSETGRIDLYKEIQSHKDSVDIKTLVARFESGEIDVFNRAAGRGFFGDVSSMPKNLAEMYSLVNDARQHFDALPVDIRRRFGFDFGHYLNSIGQKIEQPVAASPKEEVKEVIENEQK